MFWQRAVIHHSVYFCEFLFPCKKWGEKDPRLMGPVYQLLYLPNHPSASVSGADAWPDRRLSQGCSPGVRGHRRPCRPQRAPAWGRLCETERCFLEAARSGL